MSEEASSSSAARGRSMSTLRSDSFLGDLVKKCVDIVIETRETRRKLARSDGDEPEFHPRFNLMVRDWSSRVAELEQNVRGRISLRERATLQVCTVLEVPRLLSSETSSDSSSRKDHKILLERWNFTFDPTLAQKLPSMSLYQRACVYSRMCYTICCQLPAFVLAQRITDRALGSEARIFCEIYFDADHQRQFSPGVQTKSFSFKPLHGQGGALCTDVTYGSESSFSYLFSRPVTNLQKCVIHNYVPDHFAVGGRQRSRTVAAPQGASKSSLATQLRKLGSGGPGLSPSSSFSTNRTRSRSGSSNDSDARKDAAAAVLAFRISEQERDASDHGHVAGDSGAVNAGLGRARSASSAPLQVNIGARDGDLSASEGHYRAEFASDDALGTDGDEQRSVSSATSSSRPIPQSPSRRRHFDEDMDYSLRYRPHTMPARMQLHPALVAESPEEYEREPQQPWNGPAASAPRSSGLRGEGDRSGSLADEPAFASSASVVETKSNPTPAPESAHVDSSRPALPPVTSVAQGGEEPFVLSSDAATADGTGKPSADEIRRKQLDVDSWPGDDSERQENEVVSGLFQMALNSEIASQNTGTQRLREDLEMGDDEPALALSSVASGERDEFDEMLASLHAPPGLHSSIAHSGTSRETVDDLKATLGRLRSSRS